jgi:hypothetical protein
MVEVLKNNLAIASSIQWFYENVCLKKNL